jgi:hypothetical protein
MYVCAASRVVLLHERWCCTTNSGVLKASNLNMRGFVHEERVSSFLRTLQTKAYCSTSLGC